MDEKLYNETRKVIIETKMGAVWVSQNEVMPFLSMAELTRVYFEKSHSWFSQRLNHCTLRHKKQTFKEDEFHILAEAYRDIAKKLIKAADEIDAAQEL